MLSLWILDEYLKVTPPIFFITAHPYVSQVVQKKHCPLNPTFALISKKPTPSSVILAIPPSIEMGGGETVTYFVLLFETWKNNHHLNGN